MDTPDPSPPFVEGDTHALSMPQHMVWLDQQWHRGSPLYNIGVAVRVSGDIDEGILARATRQVVQAHQALRLVAVPAADGGPGMRQRVLPAVDAALTVVDLSHLDDPAARATAHLNAAFARPFDLVDGAPLWDMQLLRIGATEHLWFQRYHHIVMDGWGINLVVNEIADAYNRLLAGDERGVEAGPAYLEVAAQDNGYPGSRRFERDRDYWMACFANLPPRLFQQRPSPAHGGRSDQHAFSIPRALYGRMQALAADRGLSVMHVLMAAMAVCLARHENVGEVVIGVPVHNRGTPLARRTVGMFSSLAPVRFPVGRRRSFAQVLDDAASQLRASYRHQRFPLAELNRELKLGQLGRKQLFDVTVSLEEYDGMFRLGNAPVRKLNTDNGHEQMPLSVHVADWHPDEDVMVEFNHRLDALGRDDAARLASRFLHLLDAAVAAPQTPVGELALATHAERALVVAQWNATQVPREALHLAQAFQAQAGRTPTAVAAISDEGQFTYAQLDARADALAHRLRSLGVGPEVLVGVCLPRGLDLLASLLAVLKTGGAYLPLDPGFPAGRLAMMVDDARPAVLLTRRGVSELQTAATVVDLQAWPAAAGGKLAVTLSADNLAYVLYTSGSTGRPKGVQVTQRGVMNFLAAMRGALAPGPATRLLSVTTLSFDIAVLELFLPLLNGGCTVIASRETAGDPGLLAQALRTHAINAMQATPSTWRMLSDDGWTPAPGLLLLCGGEALAPDLAARLLRDLPSLVNLYGPTETTVWSTLSRMQANDAQGLQGPQAPQIDIGRPIDNTQVYVLDAHGEPQPVGIAGELYIAGDGLARGYFGRPDLSAERFLPNPFAADGARMYRTGDLARWLPQGVLQYLGRADSQVKVRGFRIELQEIEVAIRRLPAVRDVALAVRENAAGTARLVAYLVAAVPGEEIAAEALRSELARTLPDYMLPAQAVWLARLPLTPNGKVDRNALPGDDPALCDTGTEYAAPITPTQQALAGLWAELLGLERAGLHDNFWALGGHSLIAAQLVSRIRGSLHVELPMQSVFEAPTLGQLAQRVEQARPAERERPVGRADRSKPLPLSFAQQRLWFLHQLEPGSAHYNMSGAMRLSGRLDTGALQRAIDQLVARHESLRTTFTEDAQHIAPAAAPLAPRAPRAPFAPLAPFAPSVMHHTDLRAESDPPARMALVRDEEARAPFDLARGPLLRARLLRLAHEEHVLLLTVHHIVCDGWSIERIESELGALYSGRPLPPMDVQYADYAAWQRGWFDGERQQAQIDYWRAQLDGAPTLLELPTDRPRRAVQRHRGALHRFTVSAAQTASLRALAQRGQATLFMAVAATVQLLLSRHARQTDICIGTPVASRTRAEFEPVVGFFANMLVLRTEIDTKRAFAELLQQVKSVVLAAYAHQDLPFDQLVEALRPQRHLSHSPLFQFALVLNNARTDGAGLDGLEVERLPAATNLSKFDMTLTLNEVAGRLDAGIEYDTDLFEAATVERLAGHLLVLIDAIASSPDVPVARLAMLTGGEQAALVAAGRPQPVAGLFAPTLGALFEQQAAARPDAVALSFQGESVSYAELNRRANRVAHRLRALGVGPDVLVGLCCERTPALVVGMLGILKAGGAYLPLDPAYPRERLAYMFADARPAAIVSDAALAQVLPASSLPVVLLDDASDASEAPETAETTEAAHHGAAANPPPLAGPDHLAYVIYTSGSTGNPKGALLTHRNVLRLFDAAQPLFGFGPSQVWTLFHSYAFDFSVWEVWGALLHGARLVIVPHEVSRAPHAFHALLHREQVTVLNQTPSAFYQLAAVDAEVGQPLALRTVVFGGEALSRARLAPWIERHGLASPRLVNMYGITETTVHVTFAPLDEAAASDASIGVPLADLGAYVLDAQGGLVARGVAGELFVAGAGLARGYLGRPALTAQRFVPDPFGAPGGRLYATGDLVRRLADGTLAYLGRIDHQVKIRGFRIELGEVESVLAAQPGVSQAVVLAREDVAGDRRLVAYMTGIAGLEPATVRAQLAQVLPDYMVPSALVVLDALPLTANGKLDKAALPAPGGQAGTEDYEAPQGETEEAVAAIWAELLQVQRVGRSSEFFQLGGHSLLALQVVSRVRERLNVDVELAELFVHPTLAAYAARVDGAAPSSVPAVVAAGREQPLPLSFAQQRLWFLSRLDPGTSRAYHLSGGLWMQGTLDRLALRRALDRIVQRHEVLRTRLVEMDGAPVQLIDPEARFVLLEEALGARPLEAAMAEEAALPFDLERGPPIRGRLLQVAQDEQVLLVTMHHVVSDGWSVALFIDEVRALYAAFARGEKDPLAPLSIQYGDYAVWQRERLAQASVLQRQRRFWEAQLRGAPALLALPTDRARPPVQDHAGAATPVRLDRALSTALKDLGARHGATLYMTLVAGWAALMSRLSGQQDVVIGTPVANRTVAGLEPLIGLFVNTLALRVDLSGRPGAAQLVERVRDAVLAAQAHQDLPFEQVVEAVQPARSTAHSPVFQVMFSWLNTPAAQAQLSGLSLRRIDAPAIAVKTDLEMSLQEAGEGGDAGIAGTLTWATALFTPESARRLVAQWVRLLQEMVAAAQVPVAQLPLLDAGERQQVLHGFNANAVHRDPLLSVHGLFEAQARRSPHATALSFEGRAMSYAQLNAQANRVAHLLIARGVGPDRLVGVCLRRGMDMVVALLAVLKAGGAYVPLDPDLPVQRLAGMIDDCAPAALLCSADLRERLPAGALALDAPPQSGAGSDPDDAGKPDDAGNPDVRLHAGNLAYCIYTSGSTGKPKGALNSHGAVVNRLLWMHETYGLGADDAVLQKTPYAFDVSVWEFFWPLLAGARLVMAVPDGHKDPHYLRQAIVDNGITVTHFVPSMLQAFLDAVPDPGPHRLRRVFCSGEALGGATARRFLAAFAEVQLHNLYGPTEAAVDVTAWQCSSDGDDAAVPLGHAIANLQVHVLDDGFEPVPEGVIGQIAIAGAGLARGYLRRAGLTAEKFVPNPHGPPGARMYLSGDLGRRGAGGRIEYLGRNDHQVKIRGMRIELGEIEATLRTLPGVNEAVVTVRDDPSGQQSLAAYYTARAAHAQAGAPQPPEPPEPHDLRALVAGVLPEHMRPSTFTLLAAMPLSSNGKLDRKALPAPEAPVSHAFVQPRNETEAAVAAIWREVLATERVGVHDNFFDIGGTSLLVLRVHADIVRRYGERVTVIDLFQHTSVAQLAALLHDGAAVAAPSEAARVAAAGDRGERRRRRSPHAGHGDTRHDRNAQ